MTCPTQGYKNKPENKRQTMATQIILISHALTQWNMEGRIQGHTDVPLNNYGTEMAERLAQRLARETIHAIYTSDLKRAYQTGKPTAKQKSLKISRDIRLREARSINQERSDLYPTLPYSSEVETKTELYNRMRAVLLQIALSHDHQTVLVISHGGALEVFLTKLLEESGSTMTYQGLRMSLNRIRYDSGLWHCIHFNE